LTDNAHVSITGFRSRDLEQGENLVEIKQLLMEEFNESLVITQAGHADFKAFGLSLSEWDTFDLQSKFLQETGIDKHGLPVLQPISLRRLVLHFLGEDIQSGVHSAEKDAYYTMRLFKIYQNLAKERGMTKRSDCFDISEFENIPKQKFK
jgi:hypothetical protein